MPVVEKDTLLFAMVGRDHTGKHVIQYPHPHAFSTGYATSHGALLSPENAQTQLQRFPPLGAAFWVCAFDGKEINGLYELRRVVGSAQIRANVKQRFMKGTLVAQRAVVAEGELCAGSTGGSVSVFDPQDPLVLVGASGDIYYMTDRARKITAGKVVVNKPVTL